MKVKEFVYFPATQEVAEQAGEFGGHHICYIT